MSSIEVISYKHQLYLIHTYREGQSVWLEVHLYKPEVHTEGYEHHKGDKRCKLLHSCELAKLQLPETEAVLTNSLWT